MAFFSPTVIFFFRLRLTATTTLTRSGNPDPDPNPEAWLLCRRIVALGNRSSCCVGTQLGKLACAGRCTRDRYIYLHRVFVGSFTFVQYSGDMMHVRIMRSVCVLVVRACWVSVRGECCKRAIEKKLARLPPPVLPSFYVPCV